MYPQEKTEQAELRGRECTKPRLLALNLEFLFGLLLVVFQVMPKSHNKVPQSLLCCVRLHTASAGWGFRWAGL